VRLATLAQCVKLQSFTANGLLLVLARKRAAAQIEWRCGIVEGPAQFAMWVSRTALNSHAFSDRRLSLLLNLIDVSLSQTASSTINLAGVSVVQNSVCTRARQRASWFGYWFAADFERKDLKAKDILFPAQ
jgi:hypothetical protein